jgi:hypothetical protein
MTAKTLVKPPVVPNLNSPIARQMASSARNETGGFAVRARKSVPIVFVGVVGVAETATGVGPLFATSLKGFAGPEPFLRPTIRPNQPLRALVGGKANGAGRELRIEDGAAGFASGARAAWTAFSTC